MKNTIPIVAAVAVALFVVFAIQNYVNRVREESAAQLRGVPVVAAARDIPAGTTVTEDMVYNKSVPRQFIPRQAMTSADDMRLALGRKTRVTVYANQLLLWSDLEESRRGGLSALIPEGERAMTVGISSGIETDLLQLNDRVDIIGLFPEPAPAGTPVAPMRSAQTVCITLMQNVNILALGTQIGESYQNAEPAAGGGSVTFSVTLQEAMLLMFAEQYGDLALVLRRDGEIQVFERQDLPRITSAELERLTGDLDSARRNRTIEITKGREVEEIQVETGTTGLETFD